MKSMFIFKLIEHGKTTGVMFMDCTESQASQKANELCTGSIDVCYGIASESRWQGVRV